MNVLLVFIGGSILTALLFFCIVSIREGEPRAARVALGLALVLPLPYLILGFLHFPSQPIIAAALLGATGLSTLLLVLPIGRPLWVDKTPRTRVDERDIMFSRDRLVSGSPEYQDYYSRHPEKEVFDDRIRAAPGLLAPSTRLYHPLAFPAAKASFSVIKTMHPEVEGPAAEEKISISQKTATRFVKNLAQHYGAHAVGITELQDYHIYTHIGRGAGTYGAKVELNHKYAIAFTVEMAHSMMRRAPAAPEAMEVTKQYLSAATIATQLAVFIRSIGYPARAHIDGNYRVICPLVARDTGLGEIGRMGLLMTPRLGPRVRIGVVTTDLPLLPDPPSRDPSVEEFCRICLKCAENCPSRSIPFEDQIETDGAKRWRIQAETCFLYWNTTGTDCGRCIAVCPYSHPDNLLHGLVRWAIRRSSLARWLSLWMDDLFYGRKPTPLELPDWLQQPD